MSMSIADIVELYRTASVTRHGTQAVSPQQHALQCAVLAQQAGSPHALVAAALLHDLGHLVRAKASSDGMPPNHLHEYASIPFLRGTFTEAVIQPIRLHVEAKRYLCAVSPGYHEGLSPGAQRSLVLQGGPFDTDQARTFIMQPYAGDAVALRRWDDKAKDPHAHTPGWSHFHEVLVRAAPVRRVAG